MKRKLVSLLCVFSMAAAMLSGCGNGSEKESSQESSKPSESGESGTESAESSETAEGDETAGGDLEYAELQWYVLSYQTGNITDIDMIQAALDEYFLEKLNCKVKLNIMGPGGYEETMSTKLMSGEEVDLLAVTGDISYYTYAKMGAFYPIDTLWDEYGTSLKDLFKEDVWEGLKVDDHIYGVPVLKDNCYIISYIYNDTLAKELGLDMEQGWSGPQEMEDFLIEAVAARDAKFPEYKGMPLMPYNDVFYQYYVALEQFGCNELAVCNVPGKEAVPGVDTKTVYNFFETDEFRELCLMKQRLVSAGVLSNNGFTFEGNLAAEPFILMLNGWGYTWISEDLNGENYDSKLVVYDNPYMEGSGYAGAMTAIGVKSKNPERAMMAMELINNDPYVATMLRFGLEGEHWEKDGDGKMQLANRNADAANPGWLQWYGPFFGNLTIVEAPESYGGPDNIMLKKMAEYNNEAILASHMGFIPDLSAIENELSACNNVISEYYDYLKYGYLESPEAVNKSVDDFVAKLKENGSEKIVAEIQSQIDAWEASK